MLIAAATTPAAERVSVSLNARWIWSKAGPGSELFVGVQTEWTVGPGLSLMAEGFIRDQGKAGGQARLRGGSGPTAASGHSGEHAFVSERHIHLRPAGASITYRP